MSKINPNLPLVAFDWSGKCVHVTSDGVKVTIYPSVFALLASLTTPHTIVCERTVESYGVDDHTRFVDAAKKAGHDVFVFSSRATARYRISHQVVGANGKPLTKTAQDEKNLAKLNGQFSFAPRPKDADGKFIGDYIEKSDFMDARTIYVIATATKTHLSKIQYRAPQTEFDRFRAEYQVYRNRGYKDARLCDQAARVLFAALGIVSTGKYPSSDKKAWAQVPADLRSLLGNGTGTESNRTLLALVYFATMRTTNGDGFDRLIGSSLSGYPNVLRSEFYHWGYRTVKNRLSLRDYHRGARNLRKIYKDAGVGTAVTELP